MKLKKVAPPPPVSKLNHGFPLHVLSFHIMLDTGILSKIPLHYTYALFT